MSVMEQTGNEDVSSGVPLGR